MTLFWILAAGLIAVALAFVVLPLLRGLKSKGLAEDELNLAVIKQQLHELEADLEAGNLDQAQYEAAKRDLERELLEDVAGEATATPTPAKSDGRWAIPLLLVLLPATSVLLYREIGNQEIMTKLADPANVARTAGADPADLPPMDVLVQKLAERMENEPDNIPGWKMLGRSYLAMNENEKAATAYEKGLKVAPEDPELLLGLAEALAKSSGGNLTGRPTELVNKARDLQPNDPNVLWMTGLINFQGNRVAEAVTAWEKLAAMLPDDSEDAAMIRQYLDQARARLTPELARQIASAKPVSASEGASATRPTEPPAGNSIKVSISLDPALKDKVSPEDRLFIFARAAKGPRMPLAAVSRQAKDLPLTLELSDAMAMTPQFKLSSFQDVVVSARISKSGSATSQSGDLEAPLANAKPGQEATVELIISSIRP
ncbi:MAG TPA: c-type cytochrome biogenesis protein CcmI [Chromatiales bacterium]|nr:c-type cytochrome biogenesis protein CcmI [Chromatiales bacterium]